MFSYLMNIFLFQSQYQTATVEKLLQIDSDYWNTYISGNAGEDLFRYNKILAFDRVLNS